MLTLDGDLCFSAQTNKGGFLSAIVELHFGVVFVQQNARITKMLHGAVVGSDENFAPFVAIGGAKYVAFAGDRLVQNGRKCAHGSCFDRERTAAFASYRCCASRWISQCAARYFTASFYPVR